MLVDLPSSRSSPTGPLPILLQADVLSPWTTFLNTPPCLSRSVFSLPPDTAFSNFPGQLPPLALGSPSLSLYERV